MYLNNMGIDRDRLTALGAKVRLDVTGLDAATLARIAWEVERARESMTGCGHRVEAVRAEVEHAPEPPEPGKYDSQRLLTHTARKQLLEALPSLNAPAGQGLFDFLEKMPTGFGQVSWPWPRGVPSTDWVRLGVPTVSGLELLVARESGSIWVLDVSPASPSASG